MDSDNSGSVLSRIPASPHSTSEHSAIGWELGAVAGEVIDLAPAEAMAVGRGASRQRSNADGDLVEDSVVNAMQPKRVRHKTASPNVGVFDGNNILEIDVVLQVQTDVAQGHVSDGGAIERADEAAADSVDFHGRKGQAAHVGLIRIGAA